MADELRWPSKATGDYSNAPRAILQDEFEYMLVNARHIK